MCAGLLENFVRRRQGGERGGRRPLYDLRRDGPVRTVLKLTKLDYKDADLHDHGLNLGRNRAQQAQDSPNRRPVTRGVEKISLSIRRSRRRKIRLARS